MAALLVSIGVMMLLMPSPCRCGVTQAQREKEAELVFRGEQTRGRSTSTREEGRP